MSQTGLGVALKTLRERRTLSLREIGQLSSVDHAYVHRLESGEKTNPSVDLVEKLLKVLKPGERDAALVMWLVDHAEADPRLVEFVLNDPSISIDIFSAGARSLNSMAFPPGPRFCDPNVSVSIPGICPTACRQRSTTC